MPYASLEAVLILVLILVNGFFAMSEMALVAARKARLKALGDEGNRRARVALLLKNKMDTLDVQTKTVRTEKFRNFLANEVGTLLTSALSSKHPCIW